MAMMQDAASDDPWHLRWLTTRAEKDHRIGYGPRTEAGWVFGGSLLSQAIASAAHIVEEQRHPHALQMSFLRAGRVDEPIRYRSNALLSSRRFTSVRVDAEQAHGMVATATVGFHSDEPSPEHSEGMPPDWTGPDDSPPAPSGGALPTLGSEVRNGFELRQPRRITPSRAGEAARGALWIRPAERVPDDPVSVAATLAWVSDFAMTHVADMKHRHLPGTRMMTSLNHALWLYRPATFEGWHLYDVSSPVARDALAMSFAKFYDQDGRLVATAAQQSLLRRPVPSHEP